MRIFLSLTRTHIHRHTHVVRKRNPKQDAVRSLLALYYLLAAAAAGPSLLGRHLLAVPFFSHTSLLRGARPCLLSSPFGRGWDGHVAVVHRHQRGLLVLCVCVCVCVVGRVSIQPKHGRQGPRTAAGYLYNKNMCAARLRQQVRARANQKDAQDCRLLSRASLSERCTAPERAPPQNEEGPVPLP